MANNQDDFEEMYSSEDNTLQENYERANEMSRGMKKRVVNNANNVASKYGAKFGKVGAQATRRIVVALLPYIAAIVGFILAIILLISILVFIFSGPDMLRGQIVKMADELFSSISKALTTVIMGDDYASITEQHVLDVANYIKNMGFDLIGYGFVDDTELQQYEEDETGKITKIASSLISDYIAAENRTYMLATVSIRSLFKGATGFLSRR